MSSNLIKLPRLTLKDFQTACANGLKALTFDFETSLATIKGFSAGETFISHEQVVEPSIILCIQYKFYNDKKVQYLTAELKEHTVVAKLPSAAKKLLYKCFSKQFLIEHRLIWYCDKQMLTEFVTNILPKCHLTIGQNTDGFDFKVLHERLCIHKLPSYDVDNSLDILKMSRKTFKKMSHKLDYRANQYSGVGKIIMVLRDWLDIDQGKKTIKSKMLPYGCNDIVLTEGVLNREFNYYQKMVKKIERLVRSFLPEHQRKNVKPFCVRCKKNKQSKFDVQYVQDEVFGRSHMICNNCGFTWKLSKGESIK